MSRTMKVFGSVESMKAARKDLGSPAALGEAIVATGIDALFVLLDGGEVEIEEKRYRLYRPDDVPQVWPTGRLADTGRVVETWEIDVAAEGPQLAYPSAVHETYYLVPEGSEAPR